MVKGDSLRWEQPVVKFTIPELIIASLYYQGLVIANGDLTKSHYLFGGASSEL